MKLTTAERSARYRAKDVDSYRKRKREYARTPEERKKRVEYMRVWRAKNRARHNELARESHQRNKHKHVAWRENYHLMRNYGVTAEQKMSMVVAQDGKCGICKMLLTTTHKTHLDHCHATGMVRGILCTRCNTHLGWHEKYSKEAISYLAKFGENQ